MEERKRVHLYYEQRPDERRQEKILGNMKMSMTLIYDSNDKEKARTFITKNSFSNKECKDLTEADI